MKTEIRPGAASRVTLRQLRVFTEVARRQSFVRAAEALHLTPPAVTMQVKELEAAVGLPLLDRRGRQVALTTTGEYFVVYARRMLATLKEAEDAMARLRKVETGALHVGLVSTAKYFVPHLLARWCADRPGVDVKLQVAGNREQLVRWLHEGEIDLAVMGRPPRELQTRSEAFAAHPFVIVAPPGHPLARRNQVPLSALDKEPFIVREHGSGTRRAMEDTFSAHGFVPRISMDMSSNETIKQAVSAGLGVGFLSLHTVGLELANGLVARLDVVGTPVMKTWNIVHLLAKVLSPAAEAFRCAVLEDGEAWLRAHDEPLLKSLPRGLSLPRRSRG